MSVRFVTGRAGTGKTQWCLEKIRAALRHEPLGAGIYWILPRQATFQAQRQLACEGDGVGYFRVRVLSFEDLGREILTECKGAGIPEISERGRRMILGSLLRKHREQLQFFQSVAHHPGVAAEIDSTFSEMERCGLDAAQIVERLGSSAVTPFDGDTALPAKIHDLALLFNAYTRFIGHERLDPIRRLSDAMATIEQCKSLRLADVYIDSFLDFSASERRMIAGLGKVCRSMSITMTLDPKRACFVNPKQQPDDLSLFHRTEDAYRRLLFALEQNGVKLDPPVILNEVRRFQNPALASLERWDEATTPGEGNIELVEAPDDRAEVDAAARWIRNLTAEGMRYRDIAVLMRTEEDYRQLIEVSFAEHDIPFFIDRRRNASHHPLLRLIRAVLAVASTRWGHEPMMAVLKSGLVGLTSPEADSLENYVLEHGIRHATWISPQPWTGRGRHVSEAEEDRAPGSESVAQEISRARAMDVLRHRIVDRLKIFVDTVTATKTLPVKALALSLFTLLESLSCRSAMVKWMDEARQRGDLEEAGEHEQVWTELVELFDELVDLFADEEISLADFSGILDSALEGFDLALTPPTVDQVLVGAVDRTRTPDIKACVVLGLSEGQFPRSWREGTVFSDLDRRALARRDIHLDPETLRRLLDENFLGYYAFTRASRRLLLMRTSVAGDGKRIAPSPLWERVAVRIGDVQIQQAQRGEQLPRESISTPRQLVLSLIRWVRNGAADAAWLGIYQWLATRDVSNDAIDIARFRAWKALSYRNEAKLLPETAKALFASPLRVGIGQLESFRACPYQHFARFGLGLSRREEREVDGRDLSWIYHEVLDRIVRDLIRSKRSWNDLNEKELQQRLSHFTIDMGRKLRDELMLSTGRNRYLLDHVERMLELVAASQKECAERGSFRPMLANVRFGDAGAESSGDVPSGCVPALRIETSRGNIGEIRGKIDRVDVLEDGSACVVDYRLSAGALAAPYAYHGVTLRLLTYLLVLEKNGAALAANATLSPAAAMCVQMLRKASACDPAEALSRNDPAFHLQVKPRGIFDAKLAHAFDKQLTEGASEVVQIYIKKDGAIGNVNKSDAVSSEQFASLLRHVEKTISEMIDGILGGKIDIRPYKIGKKTPCPTCDFRSLCRLEPAPGCYDNLPGMTREEMLQRVVDEGDK